jgi:GT2 family glycosyltransferase
MNLSVIIPSRSLANLIPCVQALRRHEPNLRIIWVDDRESGCWIDDGYRSVKAECGVPPLVVEGIKPFIYARNCNLGIRAAGSDDVILLNDDALLQSPHGFTDLQHQAAENPKYGIIGAVTNIVGNQNQMPQMVGLREEPRMVCFVCVFIPRRTINLVGLLDEEFIGYGFDDDSYCLRVRRDGLKIGIYDGCFVDHGSLRSTFRGDPNQPADLRQNSAIFKQKYGAEHWAL